MVRLANIFQLFENLFLDYLKNVKSTHTKPNTLNDLSKYKEIILNYLKNLIENEKKKCMYTYFYTMPMIYIYRNSNEIILYFCL